MKSVEQLHKIKGNVEGQPPSSPPSKNNYIYCVHHEINFKAKKNSSGLCIL